MLWVNLPTCGVMPAGKQDFFLTSLTNMLATFKRNGIAFIIHANRAGDAARQGRVMYVLYTRFLTTVANAAFDRTSRKVKKEDDETAKVEPKEEGDDDDDDDDAAGGDHDADEGEVKEISQHTLISTAL